MTSSRGPLDGVRIVDLTRLLPGPYLTQLFVDLGADVVKVEDPAGGDPVRLVPPQRDGVSAAFAVLNQGKSSLAVDLKRREGVALVAALAARADVLVESFRPGVMPRLGLDEAALRATNPRLIVCSITGYGQHGPLRERAGHDLNYLARAGVLGATGPVDAVPTMPAMQMADLAGGAMQAAIGILAALLERQRTGQGRYLDVSMARGSLALMSIELARRAAGASEPRGEAPLAGGLPCYRVYETRDGQWMALAALEPKFFAAFCGRAGCPELRDKGLATGEAAADVIATLTTVFHARTQAEWCTVLDGCDCCCEAVLEPAQALADAGVLGAAVQQSAGVPRVVLDIGMGLPGNAGPVPALGVDLWAVSRRWGIEAAVVDEAVAAGAVLSPPRSR